MNDPKTPSDRPLSMKHALWLIPFILTVHNLEEALTMPAWVPAHVGLIKENLPIPIDIQFTPAQLLCSLFIATAVPWIVTLLCIDGERGSVKLFLLFLLQAIILLNVFIPHIAASIRMQQYNPGVVTAVLFNLPFSIYLFRRAYRTQYLSLQNFVVLFLTAIVVYGPIAWTLHFSGELILKIF
jgi:hypothetical protein